MTDGRIQNLNGFSIRFFCSHSAHNVTDRRIQNLNGFSIGFLCSHPAHNVTDGRVHRLPTSVGLAQARPNYTNDITACLAQEANITVAGSRLFSVISQLLLTYFLNISHFSTLSQLFLIYFPVISWKFLISQLFLVYFSVISRFSTTSQLLLDYFSSTSQLFLSHFSTISLLLLHLLVVWRLFLTLNEASETIRDYLKTEVVVT